MTNIRSPFYINQEFISQKTCDYIVEYSKFNEPDEQEPDKYLSKTQMMDPHCEQLLFNRLQEFLPEIEQRFGIETRGVESMTISWHPGECVDGTDIRCANAAHVKGKWLKNKDRDLTCHLFLSTYNDNVGDGFDPDYEVFGGKLQYPQYDFSLNPQAGTLIVHPSGPHFVHAYSKVLVGDLFYVTFHIKAKEPHIYNPTDYPGTYQQWFSNLK